jgi:chromosome segregation ATPase
MCIDEESEKKNDTLKNLSKAQSEIQLWKSKYEVEALGRIDELEGGKQKLASCVSEAEEVIENLNTKIASAERTKNRMDTELEDLSIKADDLMAELDACSS